MYFWRSTWGDCVQQVRLKWFVKQHFGNEIKVNYQKKSVPMNLSVICLQENNEQIIIRTYSYYSASYSKNITFL